MPGKNPRVLAPNPPEGRNDGCSNVVITGWARRSALWSALGLSFLIVCACQTARPSRPQKFSRDQYGIVAAELASIQVENLYDAVHRLRPRWFVRSRTGSGQPISVYLDDQVIGSAASLRQFSVRDVERVSFLGPTEAQVRFGQRNHGNAAIVITLAKPQ